MRGEHVLDPTVRARAAVRHLLESPGIAERCRPLLCADDPDWAALLEEAKTMSGGQRLLVAVAHELWEAEEASASRCSRAASTGPPSSASWLRCGSSAARSRRRRRSRTPPEVGER